MSRAGPTKLLGALSDGSALSIDDAERASRWRAVGVHGSADLRQAAESAAHA